MCPQILLWHSFFSWNPKIRERIFTYISTARRDLSAQAAIYDTMQYIKCDVSTICMGLAASMGAFLLAGAPKENVWLFQCGNYDTSAFRRRQRSGNGD